jgi:Secretion system C-terminal sorting domain/Ricin-type beta-trefoil lectin domain-like
MKKLVSILVLLATFLCLHPRNAYALFDPTHVYKITYTTDRKALEVGGEDRYIPGHFVNTWPYWGGAHQQWVITNEVVFNNGTISVRINNRNSTQQLTGQNALCSYSCQKTSAVQNYTSSGYTLTLTPHSSLPNTYAISLGGTNLNLGWQRPYGTDLVFGNLNTNDYWEITDVSSNKPVYQVINSLSYKALSATGRVGDNRVTQWTNWSLAGQQWSFEPVGDNPNPQQYPGNKLWAVRVRSTGQVLEIGGSEQETMQRGRNANVWDFWNADLVRSQQLWRILDDQNRDFDPANIGGPYHLLSVRTNLALEIGGNGSELHQEDRPANQWDYWGGAKQKWYIQYVSQNRGGGTSVGTSGPLAAETKQQVLSQLVLYPNPASSVLHLTVASKSRALSVTVTDVRGAVQAKARYMGNGQLDVAELAAGIYMVSVNDGQQTYHQKFAKQ